MDNRTRLILLYDFYGPLLTDRQRELFELHHQYDLSLGEIAENFQISRQAVHDLLRRTVSQLHHYEEKLQLMVKHFQRQALLQQLEQALAGGNVDAARALAGQLKNS
ncbi:MAG: YlxM family DNA-binding protein [Firmicutes bacterium]|nr:YlxM family DNA-binding protein [Bacillota bacterium]HOB35214.1 YlxM family DNA-binding protein [Bacillota bacterium]HPZ90148.1 YlxM family DNA-binding protein [Bacillota bacterium]HQE01094.1 YlxM family DNA-binding protein [Bacillota bacterium]